MNSWLLASVPAGSLRLKVVLVTLAASVAERTALLGLLVKAPPLKVAVARSLLDGLRAHGQRLASSALSLARLTRREAIVVAQAPAVHELQALLSAVIEIPHGLVAATRSLHLGQQADVLSGRLLAHCLALFGRVESVVVSFLTSVPEARARAILIIVEVLDGVVLAGSTVLLEAARLLR